VGLLVGFFHHTTFDVLMWLILQYDRWRMLKHFNAFLTYHGIKRCTFLLLADIIPLDGKSTISFPLLFKQARIIFLHCLYEVLGMFFSNIFYPKVITREKLIGCHSCVHSPARRCFTLGVTVFLPVILPIVPAQ
jgi:hypothetical protein